jgi:hypothetical protein
MRGLITLTFAIPLLLGMAGCERAKTKMDREVDRLCAIDGGVRVYETVTLSKENFGPDGELFPQYRGRLLTDGRYGKDYALLINDEVIVLGSPGLLRINTRFIRVSDQKLLGERVIYRRSGGDFYGPWEPSQYSCPVDSPTLELVSQIFKSEGK